MKLTIIAATASIVAVSNAVPAAAPIATPTGDVLVPQQKSSGIFQEFEELRKDIESVVQDVETVAPLVSGNASYPEDLRELISAIAKSVKDVEELVGDITSDLNGIFGLSN